MLTITVPMWIRVSPNFSSSSVLLTRDPSSAIEFWATQFSQEKKRREGVYNPTTLLIHVARSLYGHGSPVPARRLFLVQCRDSSSSKSSSTIVWFQKICCTRLKRWWKIEDRGKIDRRTEKKTQPCKRQGQKYN